MDTLDMLYLDLKEVSISIKKGEISPVELVKAVLNQIDKVDPKLNSFITVNRKEAVTEARVIEKEIQQGNYKGPLHGIPIGVKDIINTKNIKTTMGSEIFKDNIPEENASVIDSLKEAGAIIIGKQNTHQFAYGPTGDRSHSGPTRNPHDTTKMTGGSSSGSAASVAASLCFGSIGTDTGGSIRIPASFCGIVGMKATYGRVSKRGAYPVSWLLDHIGPMTRTITDNALLLNAIAIYDSKDPDAVFREKEDFTRLIGKNIKNTTIGIPSNFYFEGLNKEVAEKIDETIHVLEKLGAATKQVELSNVEEMLEAQRTIIRSDAYAVHENNLREYPNKWDEEVKERVVAGIDTKGYEYSNALQIRKLAKDEFNRVLDEVDVLVTPTMSILPPEINSRHVDDDQSDKGHIRWTITRLASPTNLNGFPSLTVPCGYSKKGMPIGIQLIAREFEEAKLYQFGYALEQELSLPTVVQNIR